MRAPAIALAFALALVASLGCGGAPASDRDARPGCGLERALDDAGPVVLPGTQVSLTLPLVDELVALRGSGAVVHACGFAVAVGSTFPGLEAPALARGAVDAAVEGAIAGGSQCEREGSSARCVHGSELALYRVLDRGAASAMVAIVGPSADETALTRIAASARIDPAARLDVLAQSGIALEAPEGMALVAPSSAGALRYAIDDESELPDVMWLFVGWESGEGHEDGSAWSDREIGRYAGTLASARVERIHPSTLAADESRDGIVFEGEVAGAPVVVYSTFRRDREGAFIAYARLPRSDAALWMPRLRRHVASFRLLE